MIERLITMVRPKDVIFVVMKRSTNSVSWLSFFLLKENNYINLNFLIAQILGERESDDPVRVIKEDPTRDQAGYVARLLNAKLQAAGSSLRVTTRWLL